MDFVQNLPDLKIEFLDNTVLAETFSQFKQRGSIRVSIVDVSNAVIMRNLGLSSIFAFDQKFTTVFDLEVVSY